MAVSTAAKTSSFTFHSSLKPQFAPVMGSDNSESGKGARVRPRSKSWMAQIYSLKSGSRSGCEMVSCSFVTISRAIETSSLSGILIAKETSNTNATQLLNTCIHMWETSSQLCSGIIQSNHTIDVGIAVSDLKKMSHQDKTKDYLLFIHIYLLHVSIRPGYCMKS